MATVIAALLPDPDELPDPDDPAADPDGADVAVDPLLLLDDELHAAARTAAAPSTAAVRSTLLGRSLTSESLATIEPSP
jgi:hypothetical protein